MELQLGDVDIELTIREAARGRAGPAGGNCRSSCRSSPRPNIGSFRADAKRVRQMLFNLLSNAIGFSEPGQTVTLAALRRDDGNRVQGLGPRARHSARGAGQGVRPLRVAYAQFAPSRRRPRPVDRARFRRAARRRGASSIPRRARARWSPAVFPFEAAGIEGPNCRRRQKTRRTKHDGPSCAGLARRTA